MIAFVFSILLWIVFIYCAICSLYFGLVTLANLLGKRHVLVPVDAKKRVAVLIPAYKEDGVILETVAEAVDHDYPREFFDVYVAADSMRDETLDSIRNLGAHVIEVPRAIGSKARSINFAFSKLDEDDYEIICILDADNIMGPGCLEKINAAFAMGVQALQCHRLAKNLNTPVALLEAINEEINNSLFRSGQRLLGSSASGAGSGMAFNFKLLKEIFSMPRILSDTGEDKEIDLQLLVRGIKMEYLSDALVYDEKTSTVTKFKNQRLRWVEAHFNHLLRFLDNDIRSARISGDLVNRFFQYLILPRTFFILIIGLVCFLVLIEQLFRVSILAPTQGWWIAVIGLYVATQILSIPRRLINKDALTSLLYIPDIIRSMLMNMARLRLHRKEFIHTPKA